MYILISGSGEATITFNQSIEIYGGDRLISIKDVIHIVSIPHEEKKNSIASHCFFTLVDVN